MIRSVLTTVFLFSVCGAALAQIDSIRPQHDFMINNSPLKAGELNAAFKGQTHSGFYRFERETLPTHKFEETTAKDGGVKHVQGKEVLTGQWSVEGDQLCFIYNEVWSRQLCFNIYRVGNCYYHYLMSEGDQPIRAWTARSSLKGERPNCEPNVA